MRRLVPGTHLGIGWIVAELIVLDEVPQHIDPKAVNSALQPEAHHVVDGGANLRVAPVEVRLRGKKGMTIILCGGGIVHRGPHFRIAPVEIGLFLQERVVVVLAGRFIELPGGTAEVAQPVIRRAAVRSRVAP